MYSKRAVTNRNGLGISFEFADHLFFICRDSNAFEKMRIQLLQFAQEPRFMSRRVHSGNFAAEMLCLWRMTRFMNSQSAVDIRIAKGAARIRMPRVSIVARLCESMDGETKHHASWIGGGPFGLTCRRNRATMQAMVEGVSNVNDWCDRRFIF
jgi:hypothetical protein